MARRLFPIIILALFINSCSPTSATIGLTTSMVVTPPPKAQSLHCADNLSQSINAEMDRLNASIASKTTSAGYTGGISALISAFAGFMAGAITPTDSKTAFGYVSGGSSLLGGGIAGIILLGQSDDQKAVNDLKALLQNWNSTAGSFADDATAWAGLVNYVNGAIDIKANHHLTFGVPSLPGPCP